MKILRSPLFLVVVFLFFSLFTRLIFLTSTPPAVTHDEMYYATEAKSIAISGQDESGQWRPWYLKPAHVLYAELPGTLMAPAAALFSNPIVSVRITDVILGTLLPLILAGIAWELTQNQKIGWITLIFASFNPWIFQFSRMNFDALFSLFFYFLGILVLLKTQGWKRLWALLPFIIGFYQYQGLKIIFIPMILISAVFVLYRDSRISLSSLSSWKKNWRSELPLLSFFALCCLFFVIYIVRLHTESASNRLNDLIFFNNTYVTSIVNTDRRLSLNNPLLSLTTNKAVVILTEMLDKYSQAFNPTLLFVKGEPFRNPFSVWSLGSFHYLDALFVAIGLVVLWVKKKLRPVALFFTGLILISPLPVAINTIDAWIMFRSSFMYPILIIISAIGFYTLWQLPHKSIKLGLVSLYILTLGWFGYQYFFRYPLYSTTGQYFAERVMDNYIHRLPPNKKVLVLASESRFIYEGYLFYNGLITKQNLPAIHKAIQTDAHQLGNVTFDTRCYDTSSIDDNTIIITAAGNVPCPPEKQHKAATPSATMNISNIPSLIDSGSIFRIYNDPLCYQFDLLPYPQVTDRKYLDVEKLSNEEFCHNLITR